MGRETMRTGQRLAFALMAMFLLTGMVRASALPRAFSMAKLDAAQAVLNARSAIMAGEAQRPGKSVDVRLVAPHGRPEYIVRINQPNGRLWVGVLGARSGLLVREAISVDPSNMRPSTQREIGFVQHAPVSLVQAMRAAEHVHGGKAVSAHPDARRGHADYIVSLVRNGAVQRVAIDSRSGRARSG